MRITKTGRARFSLEGKKCAPCFSNTHTSKTGLHRKEYPTSSLSLLTSAALLSFSTFLSAASCVIFAFLRGSGFSFFSCDSSAAALLLVTVLMYYVNLYKLDLKKKKVKKQEGGEEKGELIFFCFLRKSFFQCQ